MYFLPWKEFNYNKISNDFAHLGGMPLYTGKFSHFRIHYLLINVILYILHAFLKNTVNKDLSKLILDDSLICLHKQISDSWILEYSFWPWVSEKAKLLLQAGNEYYWFTLPRSHLGSRYCFARISTDYFYRKLAGWVRGGERLKSTNYTCSSVAEVLVH